LIALMLVAVEAALGLVFDPRYRDIPFAPLTAAAVPFLILLAATRRLDGTRAAAESVAGAVLALSAGYIVFNETFANWQSVWFCAGLLGLAAILLSVRARQAQNEHTGRERREIGIVQDDAEGGRRQRHRNEDDRRPHEVEQGHRQSHSAEHLMRVEQVDQPGAVAQPSGEPALAGERHGRVFHDHVAQIHRLAETEKGDDQKKIRLSRGRQKEWARRAGYRRVGHGRDNRAKRDGIESARPGESMLKPKILDRDPIQLNWITV
jgi:hypothetical protein